MEGTALAKVKVEENEPGALIALALEKQADPEVIKKMMDLQERWEANTAKKAFVRAMTAYKQEAPAVLKRLDKVDFTSPKGRTCYAYTNLGQIIQEITALLGKHGLSATWETSQAGNNITVTCHITHEAGHRESVTLTASADETGNKNHIQAIGSAVTYLQRYTIMAVLGLATTDADDDGRGVGHAERPSIAEPQAKKAEAPATPAQPSGELTIEGYIAEVKETKGEKKDKTQWIRFAIHLNKQIFSTFSETDGEKAQIAQENGTFVRLTYTQDGKYLNCTGIEEIEREPGQEG